MARTRTETLAALLRGLTAAVALTLLVMVGVAALAVFLRISDDWLMALNQLMKLAAIVLGCRVAIGRGGERGFFTGLFLGIAYMAMGYACCAALGGSAMAVREMLGEILIGAAVGCITGAVLANLPPRRPSRARA